MAQTVTVELFVRQAGVGDCDLLARHRCEMFREMGILNARHYPSLIDESRRYFEFGIAAGEYVAFLASPSVDPGNVIGGGGVLIRRLLPRPLPNDEGLVGGDQALVLNMFVEPAWRNRGVAKQILEFILTYVSSRGIRSVVLHASEAGRPIYEKRGFLQTNEMGLLLPVCVAGPSELS